MERHNNLIEEQRAFCKIHGEDYKITSLNITNKGPLFLCQECEYEVDHLRIESIRDSNANVVFRKWFIQENKIVQQLQSKLKGNGGVAKDYFQQQVIAHLNSSDKQIRIKLDSLRERLIQIAIKADQHYEELSSAYNKGCQKQQLKDLFSNLSSRLFEKEEQARAIVNDVQFKSENELNKITELLKEQEARLQQLDPEAIKEEYFGELIQELTQSIPKRQEQKIEIQSILLQIQEQTKQQQQIIIQQEQQKIEDETELLNQLQKLENENKEMRRQILQLQTLFDQEQYSLKKRSEEQLGLLKLQKEKLINEQNDIRKQIASKDELLRKQEHQINQLVRIQQMREQKEMETKKECQGKPLKCNNDKCQLLYECQENCQKCTTGIIKCTNNCQAQRVQCAQQ